jgi:hypothetical protein
MVGGNTLIFGGSSVTIYGHTSLPAATPSLSTVTPRYQPQRPCFADGTPLIIGGHTLIITRNLSLRARIPLCRRQRPHHPRQHPHSGGNTLHIRRQKIASNPAGRPEGERAGTFGLRMAGAEGGGEVRPAARPSVALFERLPLAQSQARGMRAILKPLTPIPSKTAPTPRTRTMPTFSCTPVWPAPRRRERKASPRNDGNTPSVAQTQRREV